VMSLTVATFPTGPLQANCYVAFDPKSCNALIVDPGASCPDVLDYVKKQKLKVLFILLTHTHFDHVFGTGYVVNELKKEGDRFGSPKIYSHADDVTHWKANRMFAPLFGESVPADFPAEPDETFSEESTFDLGNDNIFRIMHTPGHTPGSSLLYCNKAKVVFTGDTIFANSVGRTDFPGGSSKQLKASVKRIYKELSDDFRIYPGHNHDVTLGESKNDVLEALSWT
ncbi:Hydroxyacylglutathione hydrolase, partial [Giardia duodenalis]